LKKVLLLTIVLCLIGCFPMRSTFYYPSGKGGKTVLSDCYGKAGFPNTYELRFAEFRGYLSTSLNDQGNKVRLTLLINVEKDKTIEFKAKFIEVHIDDKKLIYKFDKILAWNYGEAKILQNGTLVGLHDVTNQTSFSGSVYQAYEFTTEFEISSDDFTAKLPLISIGSAVIDIGEIHFIKKSSTVIMPINC